MFTIRKRTKRQILLAGLIAAIGLVLLAPTGAAQAPQVRAVLFYSPSCGHCHQVMAEDLPPLVERYGEQLKIVYVDVSSEVGQELYRSAVAVFTIPRQRQGVPTLILGKTVLVGSIEIPERLPGLIERGVEAGGVGWPRLPGLDRELVRLGESPYASQSTGREPGVLSRVANDPFGNGLAILVLGGILFALWAGGKRWWKPGSQVKDVRDHEGALSMWLVPVLLLGLTAAAYLTAIELSGTEAVCGPVGDCRAVHSSSYASILGVPVAGLGLAAYIVTLSAWFVDRVASGRLRSSARLLLGGMALLGTIYSAYLTFLEPFVIGASCLWCLISACSMAITFLMVAGPAGRAGVREFGSR